ncbi:LuxR family transcriptional regulator [Novosphingobium sp. G106]|uniref:helix-turn-helix transcriptional regulator n=1 Tax=Novosphingobium sp. G106 TaxID=2849500 RepID=UPI0020C21F7F|nr:LuxR family transcriptional regulator [Novosphingobium sp. G106]
MSLHRVIEQFANRSRRCSNTIDLFALIEAAAREIRFPRVALAHGMAFRRPGRHLIRMDNYGDWADLFVERQYYLADPATLAGLQTSSAFAWGQIPQLLTLTRQQRRILEEAQRFGLHSGYTIPIGVIGEPHGSCSFVAAGPDLPSKWHCRAAALIGADAFGEARRLHGLPGRAKQLPRLSDRKLQCLELLAIGKTDVEIAIILGIKETTVRTYMAQLRQDFGVVSRTQLAVEALRFGLIDYGDAIPQG